MAETIETAVIGGGQSGLATSYYLTQAGRDHVVLECGERPGNVWQTERWDSFTMVTPNWSWKLPGAEYNGAYPDGFMPRRKIVEYLQRYADIYRMPVRCNTQVNSVERNPSGSGYLVKTNSGDLLARNVVIAIGFYQKPHIPDFAGSIPAGILQMHANRYRSPSTLPEGAVLVVGSGQTGAQIAEELYLSGRTVYLSVGRAGRAPRRYRGRDTFYWLNQAGFFDQTAEQMRPILKGRTIVPPHQSGTRGGHNLNLHQFARDGVHLLGHLVGIQYGKAAIVSDLMQSLTFVDQFEAETVKRIDGFIAKMGLDAPREPLPELRDGFDQPVLTELDFHAAGITSVIWGTGFRFDFNWVKPARLEADGYPVEENGVTPCPGLYFVGLPFQPKLKSQIPLGVGEPAAGVVEDIIERME